MIFDVIKISGLVRLKVGFVMLASMVIMIIASLLAHIEFGLLKPMLGLWGIFAAGPFIGCYYEKKSGVNPTSDTKEITLKADQYTYVTQNGVSFGSAVLPLGKDFPYVNNYIFVPESNMYVLLTAQSLVEAHDIRVRMIPVKKYGDNVYECTGLEIIDTEEKTPREWYYLTIKVLLLSFLVLGSFALSYILTNLSADFPGWVSRLGNACMVGAFGCFTIMLGKNSESKISHYLWLAFGNFLLLIVLLSLFK